MQAHPSLSHFQVLTMPTGLAQIMQYSLVPSKTGAARTGGAMSAVSFVVGVLLSSVSIVLNISEFCTTHTECCVAIAGALLIGDTEPWSCS